VTSGFQAWPTEGTWGLVIGAVVGCQNPAVSDVDGKPNKVMLPDGMHIQHNAAANDCVTQITSLVY